MAHALHTIALVRMSSHPRTKAYVRSQREKNRSETELLEERIILGSSFA